MPNTSGSRSADASTTVTAHERPLQLFATNLAHLNRDPLEEVFHKFAKIFCQICSGPQNFWENVNSRRVDLYSALQSNFQVILKKVTDGSVVAGACKVQLSVWVAKSSENQFGIKILLTFGK